MNTFLIIISDMYNVHIDGLTVYVKTVLFQSHLSYVSALELLHFDRHISLTMSLLICNTLFELVSHSRIRFVMDGGQLDLSDSKTTLQSAVFSCNYAR